jgi:hypothetical protein
MRRARTLQATASQLHCRLINSQRSEGGDAITLLSLGNDKPSNVDSWVQSHPPFPIAAHSGNWQPYQAQQQRRRVAQTHPTKRGWVVFPAETFLDWVCHLQLVCSTNGARHPLHSQRAERAERPRHDAAGGDQSGLGNHNTLGQTIIRGRVVRNNLARREPRRLLSRRN